MLPRAARQASRSSQLRVSEPSIRSRYQTAPWSSRRNRSPNGELNHGSRPVSPSSHRQPFQFGAVIQTQNPAFHSAAGRKFGQHRSQVPPGTLHPARRIQLGKESNQHAPSLPCTFNVRKPFIGIAFDAASAHGFVRGSPLLHEGQQLFHTVQVDIRRIRLAIVRAESEIDDGGNHPRIAGGLYVQF